MSTRSYPSATISVVLITAVCIVAIVALTSVALFRHAFRPTNIEVINQHRNHMDFIRQALHEIGNAVANEPPVANVSIQDGLFPKPVLNQQAPDPTNVTMISLPHTRDPLVNASELGLVNLTHPDQPLYLLHALNWTGPNNLLAPELWNKSGSRMLQYFTDLGRVRYALVVRQKSTVDTRVAGYPVQCDTFLVDLFAKQIMARIPVVCHTERTNTGEVVTRGFPGQVANALQAAFGKRGEFFLY